MKRGTREHQSRLTQLETASAAGFVPEAIALDVSGTDDHGLYLSLTASRNLRTGYCSDWDFNGYFKWNTRPDGGWMNTGYDFWGITWSGNQANAPGPGAYSIDHSPGPGTSTLHYLAKAFPNAGYVMRFKEWTDPGGILDNYYEWYGYFGASARQTTCNGQAQTVALQYTHTFANVSYSVSASLSGLSFNLSPGTDQWEFSVLAPFTS